MVRVSRRARGCAALVATAAAALSACGVGSALDAATFWNHCSQHEECWHDDALELPDIGGVQARTQELFPGRYAGMRIDRSGPKSVYVVGVVGVTDADRRAWARVWAGSSRVILLDRRYTAKQLDRFQTVAERIVSRHIFPFSSWQEGPVDRVFIAVYPLPTELAKADTIRRELVAALPAGAYELTVSDGTPTTTIEPTDWYLIGADGPVLTVGAATGCATFDHVESSERPGEVWVGAFNLHTHTPGLGCFGGLSCAQGQVTLSEPLGNRRLRHATVPKKNRAVEGGWGIDNRGSAPPRGTESC